VRDRDRRVTGSRLSQAHPEQQGFALLDGTRGKLAQLKQRAIEIIGLPAIELEFSLARPCLGDFRNSRRLYCRDPIPKGVRKYEDPWPLIAARRGDVPAALQSVGQFVIAPCRRQGCELAVVEALGLDGRPAPLPRSDFADQLGLGSVCDQHIRQQSHWQASRGQMQAHLQSLVCRAGLCNACSGPSIRPIAIDGSIEAEPRS